MMRNWIVWSCLESDLFFLNKLNRREWKSNKIAGSIKPIDGLHWQVKVTLNLFERKYLCTLAWIMRNLSEVMRKTEEIQWEIDWWYISAYHVYMFIEHTNREFTDIYFFDLFTFLMKYFTNQNGFVWYRSLIIIDSSVENEFIEIFCKISRKV
jgi:hypothetical protein